MPALKWQLKAVLPVAFALFNGLLLFLAATVSFSVKERDTVLMVAAAGAVAVCGALLIGLALTVGKPMVELHHTIARVREGDLEATVAFAGRKDQIGELGHSFNEMVRELRESREEIQRLHKTQMSRAEHLATLGELAAGLAHEIRNPLTGIAGVIEIIGHDLPETSSMRGIITEVRAEVQHINRIVTDLLETARPKPPQFRMADLNGTAEHSVMFARQQVMGKPINIELVRADKLPQLMHDTGQIHQVLLNLLLNAAQAIPAAGEVRVVIGREEGYATVAVTDNGVGIAPEHLANIFRPFYTTKGNGTGLGLSLAKRIVEDHGGCIEATSEVGKGSTFLVRLPLSSSLATYTQ